MKRWIILVFTLLFIATNVFAGLNDLIRQNVNSANTSYEQIVDKQPPRLWIHVRSQEQAKLIQEPDIGAWLKSIKLSEKGIDLRPIQLVDTGPKESQLRFFSIQNKDDAEQLLKELRKALPQLQLKDFTKQYETILEPSHYELWLAPNVSKLNLPK